jgi:hypothetical protein
VAGEIRVVREGISIMEVGVKVEEADVISAVGNGPWKIRRLALEK